MSSSNRYLKELKVEAAKQVTEKGHSVVDVDIRLGITTHSLDTLIKVMIFSRLKPQN